MPLAEMEELYRVVQRLRKDCPWDRKQTHRTLVPYLIEEAYEAVTAIEKKDVESLREELGDVLLQVVLHAVIAAETERFDFEDVARGIREKMVRRHPHVFGENDGRIKSAADQTRNWSVIKEKEKPKKSLLAGIPKSLPALQRAQRYGDIAASVGFDWKDTAGVLDKIAEEIGEVKAEMRRRPRRKADLEMELGDVLFTLTRLASKLNIDSERALRRASDKFDRRFAKLQTHFKKAGRSLKDCSLDEMEAVWQKMKQRPKKKKRA